MQHLYRWLGMCTLFYVGHRLCRSRTGISNIYLLEQDYQKENKIVSNLLAVELHHSDISYRLEVPFHL